MSEDIVEDKNYMKPFSQKMTEKLLRWYVSQPELERWNCHVEQKKQINVVLNEARQNGLKMADDGSVYYRALLVGIQKRSRLQSNLKLRTTDDLESVTAQRIVTEKAKVKAKPSPKLDRLLGDLEPVVRKLRDEGLSWQKVSDFLAKYHKLKCGRGYLQKVFADK
jgi:hypothetical protein